MPEYIECVSVSVNVLTQKTFKKYNVLNIVMETESRMTRKTDKKRKKNRITDMVLVSLFVAVMAVSAQIAVPVGVIPFTLQTMAVLVAVALLGCKKGVASVAVYILLGVVGLPVFAGFKGGAGVLAGPTGGYIAGFLLVGLVVGLAVDKFGRKISVLMLSMFVGLLLCYAFGTLWFAFSTGTDFISALMLCVVPYVVTDILKIIGSAILVKRLDKVLMI